MVTLQTWVPVHSLLPGMNSAGVNSLGLLPLLLWMKPLCHASQLQQTQLNKHEQKQIMKVSISYFDPTDVKSEECNHIKHILLFCNSRNKQAHCSLMSAGDIYNKHLLISNLEF